MLPDHLLSIFSGRQRQDGKIRMGYILPAQGQSIIASTESRSARGRGAKEDTGAITLNVAHAEP